MIKLQHGKIISYVSMLLILCICSFLIAKYIIWENIDKNDRPIDTSTKI